jgi:hypothetical protein
VTRPSWSGHLDLLPRSLRLADTAVAVDRRVSRIQRSHRGVGFARGSRERSEPNARAPRGAVTAALAEETGGGGALPTRKHRRFKVVRYEEKLLNNEQAKTRRPLLTPPIQPGLLPAVLSIRPGRSGARRLGHAGRGTGSPLVWEVAGLSLARPLSRGRCRRAIPNSGTDRRNGQL